MFSWRGRWKTSSLPLCVVWNTRPGSDLSFLPHVFTFAPSASVQPYLDTNENAPIFCAGIFLMCPFFCGNRCYDKTYFWLRISWGKERGRNKAHRKPSNAKYMLIFLTACRKEEPPLRLYVCFYWKAFILHTFLMWKPQVRVWLQYLQHPGAGWQEWIKGKRKTGTHAAANSPPQSQLVVGF